MTVGRLSLGVDDVTLIAVVFAKDTVEAFDGKNLSVFIISWISFDPVLYPFIWRNSCCYVETSSCYS